MALNYRECAGSIYSALGENENLINIQHCATRLRVRLREIGKVNREKLEQIPGVQGVIEGNGQLQIVIGAGTVNKVYHELHRFIRLSELSESREEQKKGIVSAVTRIIRVVGNVFIPILPAIVASGLLMGILGAMSRLVPDHTTSYFYNWMKLVANTAVTYLPVLVAVSTARLFGGNLYLGGTLGLLLMHRELLVSWSAASSPNMVNYWNILGFHIRRVNYQGHVIPVIIAVWLMCKIEKWMHRHVPEILDLFVTPLVTIIVTAFLTMAMIGPFFVQMENLIVDITRFTLRLPLGIGAFLCGAAYPLTVVFGTHHMFGVLETGMLAETGKNMWIQVSSSANFAMCMACLAVFFKTRSRKVKAVALPASISAALGITEPAIFGINLRFIRPLICGMIGAAFGAATGSMLGVYGSSYGVTGLLAMLITLDCTKQYILMLIVAGGISFILTGIFWKEQDENTDGTSSVGAPAEGKIIPQEKIPDETFSQGLVGKGIGILPSKGKIVAPFDGMIIMTAQTGHAIAIKGTNGEKILIHVGIDTIELEGKGFQLRVAEGEQVKRGQELIRIDLKLLKEKGYDPITAVFVTNSREFPEIKITDKEEIRLGEPVMSIKSRD